MARRYGECGLEPSGASIVPVVLPIAKVPVVLSPGASSSGQPISLPGSPGLSVVARSLQETAGGPSEAAGGPSITALEVATPVPVVKQASMTPFLVLGGGVLALLWWSRS
jgi:hypothetical protein